MVLFPSRTPLRLQPAMIVQFDKLMVSHDLPRSTVTNQITFYQRDFYSTPELEKRDGPPLPGAGFQIGNPRYLTFI